MKFSSTWSAFVLVATATNASARLPSTVNKMGEDVLKDAGQRLRLLKGSDDASGSGSDSNDSAKQETNLQCGLYEDIFNTRMSYEMTSALAIDDRNKCAFCWPRCGVLKDSLCPETCVSMEDIEEFCDDFDSSGSGSGSASSSGTGHGPTGLCNVQCLDFVSNCCPCGTETCLVDFQGSQVLGTDSTTFRAIYDYKRGVDPFVEKKFIEPGLLIPNAAGGRYGGPHYISGTIASDEEEASLGILHTAGIGLLYETGAVANSDGCVTVIFSDTAHEDQTNKEPEQRSNFLNGISGCDSQVTRIEYATRLTNTLDDMEIRFILNDSNGWHISDKRAASEGSSGDIDLTAEKWSDFDLLINSDTHHAGTRGTETSVPSYDCIKNVGARICASVGSTDLAAVAGATLSKFKVLGRGALFD